MELRVLRYFQAVVAELNISRAAERLHVSQPTISRQLKDLEDELGVTLFERNGRHISLTSSGEYFATQANQIIALADKTLANINTAKEISGTIELGSAEMRSFLTIAQSIKKLQQQYPKIRINVTSSNANQIRTNLKTGNFDFGIVTEPTDKHDLNFIHLPGESRWGLLVPRHSPLANHDHISLADLEGQKIIVSAQHGTINQLQDWYGESTPKFTIVATYNLLYNASLLVSAGVGYALGIDGIINTNQSDLIFIPLTPRITARTSLVWTKGQRLSEAAKTFLTQLATDLQQQIPTD
ncbi:LysR family transcriptional regulator [Lactiplantibacillus argentoratensis]|uniref:LysR family transcriptional regulator n=1 Tax=Lactiplantibacillus argentoratensis TaxID=271881 RepID=A0ABS5UHW2_9LACO|nr:LysR family transcriptional regulator [Lactiplantibacillus argentoratensis]MBT1138122.1 LysR family transcriptional regulator [Lactiplantibacillus argentoratensis]MBT1140979.1 LysR family transcriptional regulator [Lactiplantibacillus argentoratensis]